MSVVDEVKSRLDIVEVIGAYVKLTRSGRNYKGLSPFQSERTPSFFVFPDTQAFKDFSSGEHGDVFSFVMKKEGWTFGEALRELARRAGVQLEEHTPEQKQLQDYEVRLRDAIAQAAACFHHLLLTAPQAANCRSYLRDKRHLTEDTLAEWQLGYSLMDYQALINFMTARGFTMQELIDAGLAVENEEGRRYDRFRGRLMIPICDEKGRMVGFGSRSLDDAATEGSRREPKYMNSPQTTIFDKGRLLFGLDRARNAIRNEQQSVLVEGYMDVIGTHQAGFTNVVAGMGTSLTEDQFKTLKRLTKQIVLALDADAAGNRAVLRGVDVARDALDRDAAPSFDARGVIRNESKLNADIRVAILPSGKDPDEIVLESPGEWRAIIASARPIVEHVIDIVLQGYDLTDPHAKSDAVKAVAPILLDTSDAVQRDFYIQHLARRLHIDVRAIAQVMNETSRALRAAKSSYQTVAQSPSQSLPQAQGQPQIPSAEATQGQSSVEVDGSNRSDRSTGLSRVNQVDLETHLIAVLARQPMLLMDANVALTRANLDVLDEEDFLNPALRAGFRQLSRAAMGQPLPEEAEDDWLMIIADHEEAERVERLSTDELILREEAVRTSLRLRERNLAHDRMSVYLMIEEAEQAGEQDVASRYNFELHRVLTKLLRVQKALQLRSALNVS